KLDVDVIGARHAATVPRVWSGEVVVELERRLRAVRCAERRPALEALELTAPRSRDHRRRPLGHLAVELTGRLEHEAPLLLADASLHPLEPDEVRGPVRPVAHQPLDGAVPGDVTVELLRDRRARQLRATI